MKKLCLVLAALLLAACAHAPAQKADEAAPKAERNFTPGYVKEVIAKGKTTQKEILAKIGAPNAMRRRSLGVTTGPAQVWNYWTAPPLQDVAKGGVQPVSRLTVTFDDNGVVQDYSAADSSVLIK